MSGRAPGAREEIARLRAIGPAPASTAPICVALVANTVTPGTMPAMQAQLAAEIPPPQINGTLAVARSNGSLWYYNNGIWGRASI